MRLEELWKRQPNNCWCEQHLQWTPVFPLQLMACLHGKDSAWFWNKVSCRLWSFSEHLTSVNIVSWARPGFFYWRLPPPPLFPSFPFPTLYQCKHACPLSFLKEGSWLGSQDLQAIHTCRNRIHPAEVFKCLSHPVSNFWGSCSKTMHQSLTW